MSTCFSSTPVELFNIHILLSQTLAEAPSTLNLNNPDSQMAYSTSYWTILVLWASIFAVCSMYSYADHALTASCMHTGVHPRSSTAPGKKLHGTKTTEVHMQAQASNNLQGAHFKQTWNVPNPVG